MTGEDHSVDPPAAEMFRVLLADEGTGFTPVGSSHFLERGWRVSVAGSPGDVPAAIAAEPPDAVVLDMSDPRGAGFAVVEGLRRDFPFLPVIVVAERPRNLMETNPLRSLVFDLLDKPLDLRVLECRARAAAERTRLERALRDSEAQYRVIFETANAATLVLDDAGGIARANQRFAQMVGVSREDLEGKRHFGEFVVPEDQAKWRYYHQYRRVNPTAIPATYEMTLVGATRQPRVTQASVGLIPDGTLRVCSLLDVTDYKRAERAAAAAARVEATASLADALALEFNNLMIVVLGNAQLLEEEMGDNPEARRMLYEVQDAAKKSGELTGQLTAFARGGMFEKRNIDLRGVIEQVASFQARTARAGVNLEADLAADLYTVRGDESQIAQAVTGLIENASESIADTGTVTVIARNEILDVDDVRDKPGIVPGEHVVITVRDNGCGMSPDVRDRLFEPFYSTKYRGRGLGMAAIYGIVKNHSGFIGVESEAGAGTTVRVIFPADLGRAPLPQAPSPAARPTGHETILIVDDEPVVLRVLEKSLTRLGYKVLAAPSAEVGLQIARDHDGPIHLAILDLHMPGTGGLEMFGPLRETRPDTAVLISSGYDPDSRIDMLLRSGAAGFLRKPYSIEALGGEVRRAIGSARI